MSLNQKIINMLKANKDISLKEVITSLRNEGIKNPDHSISRIYRKAKSDLENPMQKTPVVAAPVVAAPVAKDIAHLQLISSAVILNNMVQIKELIKILGSSAKVREVSLLLKEIGSDLDTYLMTLDNILS